MVRSTHSSGSIDTCNSEALRYFRDMIHGLVFSWCEGSQDVWQSQVNLFQDQVSCTMRNGS